jgi:hypothetical protein
MPEGGRITETSSIVGCKKLLSLTVYIYIYIYVCVCVCVPVTSPTGLED